MDAEICRNFLLVKTDFPDKLIDGKYQFKDDEHSKKYCDNGNCNGPLDKINTVCLYLFNEFFGNSSVFESVSKSNIHIVEYIMIWLNYMLNLTEQSGSTTNLEYFYKLYINTGKKYNEVINGAKAYDSYKDLIDKNNYFSSMDKSIIIKLYNAFNILCNMYNEYKEDNTYCEKYLNKAKEFVKIYDDLNQNPNNSDGSSYGQVLCTLSNDYNNFKNKCKDIKCSNYSSFPTIEKKNNSLKCSEKTAQGSEVTSSSSSIGNTIISVLSIFGAIAFFLGISYKYSLFGFRKRFQKQKLREKLKNIKKRMNQ
ncbi:hypothetical protein YYC_04825 [Plasmodium yoelii 17X]|uniref:YIR protein n=1 Tax=Plasmodium yoelii 17X TaxID=1323249 RepID=V7PEY7_PLAYE|nr:hypothetical protein YYC_04825 [Plasmodium yoelii 17X]